MAKEIFSNRLNSRGQSMRNRFLSLIQDRTTLAQKPFHEVGVNFVQFPQSKLNSIPADYAREQNERFAAGKKFTGGAAAMLDNAHALMESAKKRGTFQQSRDWYANAHDFAKGLAKRHGIDVAQASGVIASLSGSGGEWEVNKRNADKLIGLHNAGRAAEIHPQNFHGVESSRLANAVAILHGQHPRQVLGDLKEGNFFENINDPGNQDITTQDTQMSFGLKGFKRPWQGAAGGARDLQHPEVYKLQHNITAAAGKSFGLSPIETQPVLWDETKALTPGKSGTPVPQHPLFGEYYDLKQVNPRFHSFSNAANSARGEGQ